MKVSRDRAITGFARSLFSGGVKKIYQYEQLNSDDYSYTIALTHSSFIHSFIHSLTHSLTPHYPSSVLYSLLPTTGAAPTTSQLLL